MPSPRVLILVAASAAASGCLYDFKNPAETLRAGEASGTVLAERSGPGVLEAFPGVSVSLKGSSFDQTTRASGRFALVDLPTGRHTLLFRKGTTWTLERDVEIGFGKDGQPEGVDLGKVVLRYATPVEGTVTLTGGVAMEDGVAVDETSGQTAVIEPVSFGSPTGKFRFPTMAPGTHLIKVAVRDSFSLGRWVSDQLAVVAIDEVNAGQVRTLAPLTVRTASSTGRLRFRVQLIGDPGVTMAEVTVTLVPDPGVGPIVPDSQGFVDVTVPEGLYQVSVTTPPPPPRVSSPVVSLATVGLPGLAVPPPAAFGVVMTGKVAEVGSVYVVADTVVSFSSQDCRLDSDCGTVSGGQTGGEFAFQCKSGQCFTCLASAGPLTCSPLQPPPAPGAAMPVCPACDALRAGGPCQAGPDVSGFCDVDGTCHPNGCAPYEFICTPDGSLSYSANPGGC